MNSLKNRTLGDIVTEKYQAAVVLEKYGIDFCCQGNRTLDAACLKAGINTSQIIDEIEEVSKLANPIADFRSWSPDQLADYIYRTHHQYIEQVTPTIKTLLTKVCEVHGERHPELLEIRDIFFHTSDELAAHMKVEETVLFPFIKRMVQGKLLKSAVSSYLFSSVSNPIHQMNEEHLAEGAQLEKMAKLSHHYSVPADACTTYRIVYQMLKEYEKDMHLHIHLENNILFEKAIELEAELTQIAINE